MNFLTVSDIAEALGADRDAVAYAIRKTRSEPVGRAGLVRLFPITTLATVKNFIAAKRLNTRSVDRNDE